MKTIGEWMNKLPWKINQDLTHEGVIRLESWAKEIQQDAIKSCTDNPSVKKENKDIENKVKKLVGKDVYIKWCNPKYDWPTFYVIEYNKTNSRVLLRGIDDLNGNRHDGCKVGVYVTEIESIREIGPK